MTTNLKYFMGIDIKKNKKYHNTAIKKISNTIHKLGPVATRILIMQCERLVTGATRYPSDDFSKVSRDWLKETLEERLDGDVYLTRALLEIMDARDQLMQGNGVKRAKRKRKTK